MWSGDGGLRFRRRHEAGQDVNRVPFLHSLHPQSLAENELGDFSEL
jgi:hypothetical protein